MRIIFTSALTVLLGVSFVLYSCDRNIEEDTSGKMSLAFVAGAATDFWSFAQRGSEKAGNELPNVDVEFRFTSDGDRFRAEENNRGFTGARHRWVGCNTVRPHKPETDGR